MISFNEKLQSSLADLFKARFPYVYIPTWEEKRAIELVKSIAYDETKIKHKRKMYVWAQTTGFICEDDNVTIKDTIDPISAMDFPHKIRYEF